MILFSIYSKLFKSHQVWLNQVAHDLKFVITATFFSSSYGRYRTKTGFNATSLRCSIICSLKKANRSLINSSIQKI